MNYLGCFITVLTILKPTGCKRIVHGRPATIDEFPYQVSLEIADQHTCGGTIIHPVLILSAGHCIQPLEHDDSYLVEYLRVRAGASIAGRGGKLYNVTTAFAHPDFSQEPDRADVSLILLETPIIFNKYMKPIHLPKSQSFPGEVAWITGYGLSDVQSRRDAEEEVARVLRVVRLPIVPLKECRSKMRKLNATVTDGMLCAGMKKGHSDACKGDSGGPLAIGDHLVGITSWGIGCGQKRTPGVYSDVYHYLPWIELTKEKLFRIFAKEVGKKKPKF